jgi:predicted membrane protein DUF2306
MVLALCANGLLPGRLAFVLLDSLWFTFTLVGVVAVRRGDLSRHRAMMIRSYALTFSAITLRTWKFILVRNTRIDPVHLYMIDAWMGFVPNKSAGPLFRSPQWNIQSRIELGAQLGGYGSFSKYLVASTIQFLSADNKMAG